MAQPAQTKYIKKYISILSKLLDYIPKLVRMKNIILDRIKLKLLSNYFLNELTKHVKKINRSKGFGSIISKFTWLRYNNINNIIIKD